MHDDAIQAQSESAVRRRAVPERIQQEAESPLRFIVQDAQRPEDPPLQLRLVDTDAPAAQLAPVVDQVVSAKSDGGGIVLQKRFVLRER